MRFPPAKVLGSVCSRREESYRGGMGITSTVNARSSGNLVFSFPGGEKKVYFYYVFKCNKIFIASSSIFKHFVYQLVTLLWFLMFFVLYLSLVYLPRVYLFH
jgi:hypothetical protein